MTIKDGKNEIVKTNPDPTEAVKEALTLAIKNLDDKFASQFRANDAAVILARQELKDQLLVMDINIASKFLSNKDLVDQLGLANASSASRGASDAKGNGEQKRG